MSTSIEMQESNPTSRPQQKPSLACEECRRRKLRCDRRQPKCGLCETSGIECQITARPPRGPKRGYLKVLQARIANLEELLVQQVNAPTNPLYNDIELEGVLFDSQIELPLWDLPPMEDDTASNEACEQRNSSNCSGPSSVDGVISAPVHSIEKTFTHNKPAFDIKSYEEPCGAMTPDIKMSELMQADLDQLYFDRIHSFMPIQHQSRYLALRQQKANTEGQTCLRYAMWTLAASMSAHYQNVRDPLYECTRQSLQSLDSSCTEVASTNLEQIQAWLLLAIHEFMCVDFRRGWMSAGKAFRIIQLSWRHGVDSPHMAQSRGDWVESEQKRRTYWVAFCLDRFISMRIGSPLTFSETAAVRLPCPESNFQNDQPVLMGFLSEALIASNSTIVSQLTECIIVATISGQALSHRHQCHVGDEYFNASQDSWTQHQWANAMQSQHMERFLSIYSADMQQFDPMLLFIGLMYRVNILHLYETTSYIVPATEKEHHTLRLDGRKRASLAAKQIVDLTSKFSSLNSFKIHPLTPIPLSLCVEFFVSNNEMGESFTSELKQIMDAMRCLKSFNNIGKGILHLHEDCRIPDGTRATIQ